MKGNLSLVTRACIFGAEARGGYTELSQFPAPHCTSSSTSHKSKQTKKDQSYSCSWTRKYRNLEEMSTQGRRTTIEFEVSRNDWVFRGSKRIHFVGSRISRVSGESR